MSQSLAVFAEADEPDAPQSLDSEENLDGIQYHKTISAQLSESSTVTTKSEREKVEEFTLRRNIERLRVFYSLLQVAMSILIAGVLLTTLTEILWRLLPVGPVPEGIISGLAALAWFLTSITVVLVSICPTDELDIDAFVAARPGLTARFALLPLVTGGLRALEFPFPRWISVVVGLAWLAQGWVMCCKCCFPNGLRQCLQKMSFVTLAELWYVDVVLASTVNEAALNEPGIWTSVWLAVHAAVVVLVLLWLRWRRVRNTARFSVASYLVLSWNGSYFACRGIDLALDYKEWEEGRREDLAIMAAMAFALLILLPMLFALLVGQRRLFHKMASWLDHSRSRRLQDGAFMAMLLDSYVVEVGQPWWLTESEVASAPRSDGLTQQDELLGGSRSWGSGEWPGAEPRPGFVAGTVVSVAEDLSFCVKCRLEGRTSQLVEVKRGQEVLPWPSLLKMGRKNLRCVDWAALSPTVLEQNSPSFSDFALSRPVGRGELIDFFVSHSWSDSPAQKWRAMQLVAENFYQKNGRYPTLWIDKFCIDQRDVADGLRVLPVNVMSCRKMLCLSGRTYHTRLWCAWELCVLLSFMSMEMALKQMVVLALSESSLMQLTVFDCSQARCYNPNEEHRLRRVIEAIGKHRFEIKIRALGQLVLDREINGDGLLGKAGSDIEKLMTSSDNSAPKPPSKIFAPPKEEPARVEDSILEVKF